jgi:hypothetical protein
MNEKLLRLPLKEIQCLFIFWGLNVNLKERKTIGLVFPKAFYDNLAIIKVEVPKL